MKRPVRAAAWLLCLSGAARAQTSMPGTTLRLAEALRLARERNPALLAARADLAAAEAQREIAIQVPNPTFVWTTQKIPTDGTSASTVSGNGVFDRSYDSVLGLAQLVEVGGKRASRRTSADEGIAGARARLADAERTLAANVVRSYVAALVASAGAEAARESAESFARTAGLVAERERAGDASASERAQVEMAAGRFRADAALADLAARNARRVLGALLDVAEPSPGDSLEDLARAALGTARDGVSDGEAAAKRPDLLQLEAAVRKAEADLALQKALRVPDPTLLAQYEREPPDQRNTVGIGVSIPLPVFNRNAGAIHAAEAALDGARRDLAKGRIAVRVDLGSSHDALETAAARARLYGEELLPRATRVRETVEYAYAEGAASLLELLEAERSANDVRAAAAAARGDLVNAWADFASARLLSVLPEGTEP